MRKTFLVLLFCLAGFFSKGNKTEWRLNGEVLIYSKHMWRGMGFGESPSVEPSVTLSKGRFSLNLWAAKTFDDTYTEIDIIPSFRFGSYQITIYDYYNPKIGENNNYFKFKDGENCHSTELAISKEASKKVPVKLLLSSFFFGDKNPKTGNPYFSTYAEASIPFNILNLSVEPIAGITTHKGYYANKFSVINTSVVIKKDIPLTNKMSLPLKLLMVYNPTREKSYLSLGTGISF